MTLTEYMVKQLTDRGMWEKDAITILTIIKAEEETKDIHWNDLMDQPAGYPIQLIAVLLMIIKQRALEWVDENCPEAFYRELLTPQG